MRFPLKIHAEIQSLSCFFFKCISVLASCVFDHLQRQNGQPVYHKHAFSRMRVLSTRYDIPLKIPSADFFGNPHRDSTINLSRIFSMNSFNDCFENSTRDYVGMLQIAASVFSEFLQENSSEIPSKTLQRTASGFSVWFPSLTASGISLGTPEISFEIPSVISSGISVRFFFWKSL